MTATIIQFPVRPRWSSKRVFRLARTVLIAALLVWAASNFFAGQSATATSSVSTVSYQYVTVYPGDSLWSIAEAAAPGENTGDFVQKIIDLNNLQTAEVAVGQRLALPNY